MPIKSNIFNYCNTKVLCFDDALGADLLASVIRVEIDIENFK